MRAALAVRGVLCLLSLIVVAGGCSPTASADPPGATSPGAAEPRPAARTRVDPEPFEWPDSGWLRLDLDSHIVFDGAAPVVSTTSLFAAWAVGRFEWWTDGPDPLAPEQREVVHRRDLGATADARGAGLRGQFEAGRADGLAPQPTGPLGGHVFTATHRNDGVTVSERWEIGAGPAPWLSNTPSGLGS